MKRRVPGLTLVEMLATLAIMAVLGIILARIYDVSRTAYASGTGQIALQQKARTLSERMTPLLVSALPPNEVEPAVATPPVDGTISSRIVFTTPARPFDPRKPTYVRNRILHDLYGNVVLDGDTDGTTADDRVLGRDIGDLQFSMLSQNVVKVAIEVYGNVRGATNRDKKQSYRLETLVQIPFYSTR